MPKGRSGRSAAADAPARRAGKGRSRGGRRGGQSGTAVGVTVISGATGNGGSDGEAASDSDRSDSDSCEDEDDLFSSDDDVSPAHPAAYRTLARRRRTVPPTAHTLRRVVCPAGLERRRQY